jgi:hypothetical protein
MYRLWQHSNPGQQMFLYSSHPLYRPTQVGAAVVAVTSSWLLQNCARPCRRHRNPGQHGVTLSQKSSPPAHFSSAICGNERQKNPPSYTLKRQLVPTQHIGRNREHLSPALWHVYPVVVVVACTIANKGAMQKKMIRVDFILQRGLINWNKFVTFWRR